MSDKLKYNMPVIVCIILLAVLLIIPTGYEVAVIYKGTDRCAARVISVNNSAIIDTGLIRSGEQTCQIELLGGKFKGQTTEGYNVLNGSLESDKIFSPGDKVLVVIDYKDNNIISVNMIDHYRINLELILALCFVAFLAIVAGRTGIRAFLSFIITVLMIWKVLVPLYLNGFDPIITGFIITTALTVIIISLVYGFEAKTLAAAGGAVLGLLVTAV